MNWIFVRGLLRDQRHWGSFPQTFSDRIADAKIVTLDLPGNGTRHNERSPARIDTMARWCREEALRRGLKPPYYLLAVSMGAMVSVAWAAAHPAELRGAVLINTSLRPHGAFWQRLRPSAWPMLLRMAISSPDARVTEETILRLTSRYPERACEVLEDWTGWRQTHPVSRASGIRQLLAAARFRAPAHAPAVPLLLLSSANDGLVNPACSRRLAKAWGLNLIEHPAAGHDLTLDDGAWVAERVRQWLQAWAPEALPDSKQRARPAEKGGRHGVDD